VPQQGPACNEVFAANNVFYAGSVSVFRFGKSIGTQPVQDGTRTRVCNIRTGIKSFGDH
jgi:hypothetical protein